MKDFESRKEEIVEIASQLFDRLGYENTSMSKIAQALGSGKASLYYYFKSKEELYFSVIKKESEKYLAEFKQMKRESTDIIGQLRYFLMIPLNAYEPRKSLTLKMLLKSVKIRMERVQNIANEMKQGLFKVFRELLQEGIDTGVIKADLDVERYMIVMLSISRSIFYIELPGIEIINIENEVRINYEFLIETMLDGIKK